MTQTTGSKRGSRLTRLVSAVALLAVVASSLLTLNTEPAHSAETPKPTVGLVNEDLPATFNNQEYTFGSSFVDLISKDTDYNWTVFSRPVAEKAFKDGSVDALIYLPQSFSQNILTLQEVNPTKATMEYKLQPELDKYAYALLESRVLNVVDGFNHSVVKMYYSSLASDIAAAEGQMNAVLDNQVELVADLTSNVQSPFSDSMKQFSNLLSNTTSLKSANAANIEAQNSMLQSVTSELDNNSKALSGQLPKIEEYLDRQATITEVNATNSIKAVEAQAASDLDFYGKQHDDLRTSLACTLSGQDLADAPEPCANPDQTIPPNLSTMITDLETNVADYNAFAEGIRDSIEKTIPYLQDLMKQPHVLDNPAMLADLKAQKAALEGIRNSLNAGAGQLPSEFFAQNLTDLTTWHGDTLTSVKDASLETNTVQPVEVNDWDAYDPDSTNLHVDNSNTLKNSLTELISGTAATTNQITGSISEVPDNSAQFDAMFQDANNTYGGAQTVLNDVNNLVEVGNTDLNENQEYYDNFSTVLANTRTPGVDTDKLYDFFSGPITAKNISDGQINVPTEQAVIVTDGFDPKLALVFVAGIVLGIIAPVSFNKFRGARR